VSTFTLEVSTFTLEYNVNMPQRLDDLIWEQERKAVGRLAQSASRHIELLQKTLGPLRNTGAWLLDAGCGPGDYLPLYREMGLRAVGADISPVTLKRARDIDSQNAVEAVQLESDVGLPHRESTFDVIFCGEVIAQIRHPHSLLSEFNRLLRDGGLLIVTTAYHGWIKNVLIAAFWFTHHYYPHNYRLRFFTPSSLMRSLRRAGFLPLHWQGGDGHWLLWRTMYVTSRKIGPPGRAPNPLHPSGDCE
jgi:2-polyprenyl-6-hydroxyphenyl methylase/3-demethylubiquinone-9 3-methyltransferase